MKIQITTLQRRAIETAREAIITNARQVTAANEQLAGLRSEERKALGEVAELERRAAKLDRQAIAELRNTRDYLERLRPIIAGEEATAARIPFPPNLQALVRSTCRPLFRHLQEEIADAMEPYCNTRDEALALAANAPAFYPLEVFLHEKSDFGAQGYLEIFDNLLASRDVWSFEKYLPLPAVSAPLPKFGLPDNRRGALIIAGAAALSS
jgi:hypothetical protein